MDKVFKSSDATRDAAMMHRIVEKLESEQHVATAVNSETASEKKGEFSEVERV
jgi:ubiquinone biosynthesis protein Coq4